MQSWHACRPGLASMHALVRAQTQARSTCSGDGRSQRLGIHKA